MSHFFSIIYVSSCLRIGALIFLAIPLIKWGSNFCIRLCKKYFSKHVGMLAGHIVFYSGLLFIGVAVLHELGFNVTALLGAAGVFGVAIGFASQTSISNIISGLFLLVECPFSVGDMIKSGDVVGFVESIELLSVRVRTADNKLVRLPNEMVLKHQVTNLTYYPYRRIDHSISVPYSTDISSLIRTIYEVIESDPLFLTHPAPSIMMHKIENYNCNSEIRLFFSVRFWVAKDQFTSAPSIFMQRLKSQFDRDEIIITIVQNN